MRYAIACPMIVAAVAVGVRADEPLRVTVSSVSGRSVFLDKGRAAGITPGLRVRLYPPGSEGVEVVVADASTSSARIDLPEGMPLPPVGTPGELDIPATRPEKGPPEEETKPPPHPPWKRQEEARAADQPLLSPPYTKPSKQRPAKVHGRVFTQWQFSGARSDGASSEYLLARLGTRLNATNLFGHGERLEFAGSIDQRSVYLDDAADEHDTDLVIDAMSYTIGGEKYSSYRAQGGRFISTFLPELGLVDGLEGALQFENGVRIGLGGGAYPEPFDDRQTGDDLGMHAFIDYQSEDEHYLAATLGFQKTWHEGAPDRDVIVGRISVKPTEDLWLFGSAKVDVYSDGDQIKSAGPDLTEAFVQARYSPWKAGGVSVSYSHYTWPDVDSNEFQSVPDVLVQTGRVDRTELTGWYEIVKDVRLTGRAHYWTDQRGDGVGGEIAADWERALSMPAALHADVFFTEGSFSDTMGFRVEARPHIGDIQGLLGYELLTYSSTGLAAGGSDEETRHTVRGGISIPSGRWFYNLNADYYFGDTDGAFSLGAYVEYRF